MKKVLVIDLNGEFGALSREVVDYLGKRGLVSREIDVLPRPMIAESFDAFIFMTRINSDKADILEKQYPAKITIVLSEEVSCEDEDGSVIPICKQDPQYLEKLYAAIIEHGSESLKSGDKFTFPRGRDNCDGYGIMIGEGRAVLLVQHGKRWYYDKGAVPPKAKKLTPRLVPLVPPEVALALAAASIVITDSL